ncbi:MAG: DNA/RNA nuclease SfsA, partial [Sporomusaceae bacterium]|nr:DNA/RNA nuclease SfsA [Sporomusaceae bacterium]
MNRKNSLGDFPVIEAVFIRRPNRFVVICTVNGQETTAYMPNPGRMWELLFAGVALYVKKNPPEQKLPYTVLAVKREDTWIMLHTHWANDVAEVLLRSGQVPGLETATVVRREVKFGQHRFDFLLTKDEKPYYLEVKSCTLFEGSVAMFPDAITERGRSHVETLTQLAQAEIGCGVLILIHW